jgi:hypothetical protein
VDPPLPGRRVRRAHPVEPAAGQPYRHHRGRTPQRTTAQVARILRASSGWSPSESTLSRLFHRRELMGPAAGDEPSVFGRFEAATPNERWAGDGLWQNSP